MYVASHPVVCLPATSAVPVLACRGILFCGQPPNCQAAVPLVTTPSRALSMYETVDLVSGSLPMRFGFIGWTVLPSALMIALPTLGWYIVPPLAMAE